jgi:ligand-binding sensor domain-containing protein
MDWNSGMEGLQSLMEVNWTVYNTSNSGLPSNYVNAIAIDGQGSKWIGTSKAV